MSQSEVLDAVDRRVRSIVYTEIARAYGVTPPEPLPVCDGCGGDGCEACGFTGDPT